MQIADLLTPERTLYGDMIASKKRALEVLSNLFTDDIKTDSSDLFEAFIEREKLGSTAVGHGVAIPHIRSSLVKQPIGALILLKTPIDFDALHHESVDILFGLIVPEQATDEHLYILAHLAEVFSNPLFRQELRQATDAQSLYQLASHAYVE